MPTAQYCPRTRRCSRAASIKRSSSIRPNSLPRSKKIRSCLRRSTSSTLHEAHNSIKLYTWSDTECCLPKGATRCTLINDPALALKEGNVIIFEEVISPATGSPFDADPAHRHAVRLTKVTMQTAKGEPLTDLLTGTPIAEIEWDAEDALPFPLCVSVTLAQPTGDQFID